ncbi:MAG: hypothetical protein ACXVD2_10155, partial [Actinomycetota bacterium]
MPALTPLLEAASLEEACSVLLADGTLTVVDPARALVLAALERSGDRWLVVTATARDAERLA